MINTRNAGLLLGLGVLGLASVVPANAQFVVSYFNFNTLTASTTYDLATTPLTPTQGNGSLTSDFLTSTGSNRGITSFAGSTVNAEGADPAGQALALQASNAATGTPNNGRFLELRTSTSGFSGLTLSFATRRSGTGFNADQFAYSTDGGVNFTNFGSTYNPPDATTFALQSYNLSGISSLNNNADVRFRIVFNGASASAGNNRIDNLKLTAAVPAPSSVAVMALGGLMPMIAIARRRRAAK